MASGDVTRTAPVRLESAGLMATRSLKPGSERAPDG
jgi:hypothetical protein